MGSIVRFPSDLVTDHDRRRLKAAAEGSPFDLEFRKSGSNAAAPYLVRCGHLRPSYRLRKSSDGWEAIDLNGETGGGVVRARRPEELIRELAQRHT